MSTDKELPSDIYIDQAVDFAPAIAEETYVKMMPKQCALEIAVYACGWKEGVNYEWVRASWHERPNQKVLRLLGDTDAKDLAALSPEQLFKAIAPASGWV
eukprot:CAMPEP_0119298382 /NCGR_PEP_ID=MMETSP1333-20130426/586_1 /TAXON_ID=418940 /ORGANISM="Scyphosphaera apsteinii, Strain RCC1455" /LENGTH=99 /DNA_ID=CAMNT_0007299475 /DNA_START=71 /DNA_END=370 /DNA_ORIENTATION=+